MPRGGGVDARLRMTAAAVRAGRMVAGDFGSARRYPEFRGGRALS
ncbi:hypothetical protein BURPS406E_K0086 [Burkholderia pseudomallei 406e]|uniref:Uncharacterized protein n=1 Tax=Burkholderia pseudomallei (strain 1106a) TaxID=357348 RepID=A3NYA6_BURP0|nr:hypothetical protein BURPS1106A_3088 [Burkholderia pseudomallei 1106a]EBA48143.1 hypothetical protein BURPS305_3857 [Burkholderia pseudomallei 305]EDO86356.1 hypothetical protein BURPS406E_K0086 [Burkholderia pseudomallei 406e]EEH30068.1 conserved hypothetical protein [Burkholderia pseudomallei Pakistan 9]EES24005.1 hypothetical protein BURPS1106B_A2304 [Burkholderia pseudomallei 1106b]